MKYIAHTSEDKRIQLLSEHLKGVAALCRNYSVDFFKDYAELCGLTHDIGKYTEEFQQRIRGDNIRVGHALCGAQEIDKLTALSYSHMIKYCIAGHHTGLPDGGTNIDNLDASTLHAVLKRESGDYSAYKNEIDIELPPDKVPELMRECRTKEEIIEIYSFFTRYLYSCLTDADFIDTEQFVCPEKNRGIEGSFKEAYELVCQKMEKFNCETLLQKSRSVIQEQIYVSMESDADVYTINMPTGSGKTLCSIRAALKTAIEKKKKRIVYVIPYVSIIEQTAAVFEDIFGQVLPVVQHHSNFDFDSERDENELTSEKIKFACENWDAPLIITTSIQFFESLYHYRSSSLRKLHNLADCIIIFDEIHMLPVSYIQPCLRAIGYITKYLNSIALLMSATMPDYSAFAEKYIRLSNICDAVSDKSLFGMFNKCSYKYMGKVFIERLAETAQRYESALIVVNKRQTAKALYDICAGNKYHLSTYMTPRHRSCVIKNIRKDIENGVRLTVISTSLIEAGVDLDFEAVFRENAGIDNILQSGGRCNREGKRANGDVFVFETDECEGEIMIKANITRSLFAEYEDISTDECIKEYYSRLFKFNSESIKRNSITSLMCDNLKPDAIPFRTYAENFRLIDCQVIGVAIPNNQNKELIEKLSYGVLSVKRRLQQDCASVKLYELENMLKEGFVTKLPCNVYVLTNTDYYDENTGLTFENKTDYIL